MLWLASLKAAWSMGERLIYLGVDEIDGQKLSEIIAKYKAWFAEGRTALRRLWDETRGYFHIDAATDDIMADQLFGVWYSRMLGLEEDEAVQIIPREQAVRALRTIFEKNVLGFGGGRLGAVNGRTKDGRQLFNQQGDEVWVGTSYALAANEVLHGLINEGLQTAFGVYHVTYSPYGHGYFFKTPEAYCNPEEGQWNNPAAPYGDKVFRATKYMRPGAVWALAEALLKNRP
jgi:non-lysosomal glucosylceramidase